MLSIIIPALNEEKYLPILLESIKKQAFDDYEIILADAGSQDKTIEIARSYNCKITPGGLPAKGRNEGAKVALGEWLFFLDADVILPEHFLENVTRELGRRKLGLTSFCLTFFPKKVSHQLLLDIFYNSLIVVTEAIFPHAATGIMVKKDVFEKTGGFDESIKLAEDHYFARQAIKKTKTKFGIIRSARILVSDRRFREDGWIKVAIKYFLCELHLIFIGPVRSDIFKYRFNHYRDSSLKQKDDV